LRRVIQVVDAILTRLLSYLVVIVLFSMVGLAFLQVVLRNLFSSGIPWVDIILRNLVLWIGMLGGALATRYSRQISMDVFSRLCGQKLRIILAWISGIFTIGVCIFLAAASWRLVASEREFGGILYGAIPLWYAQVVIPVGFGLIGLQVIFNLLLGRFSSELNDR